MASYAEIANPALFIDMSHVFHKTSGIESKSGDPVCVCSNVSAFVEAFRTSQSLPVQATTAVPKIHVVFQSQ
jgi:hypothetical protein